MTHELADGEQMTSAYTWGNTDAPERGFVSRRSADSWEEALVVGNGVMGALVMGDPTDETIIMSHARLYLPWEEPVPPPHTAPHLAHIRALMTRGEYQRAADFVVELSREEGWGGKRWTDPFVPACDLRVSMVPRGVVRDYARSVDFRSGVAAVRWSDDRGEWLRRTFVSRADNVMVLHLRGPSAGIVDCELGLAARPAVGGGYWDPAGKFAKGISSVEAGAEGEWLTYHAQFRRRWTGSLRGYDAAARVLIRGGVMQARGETLVVEGADTLLVLLRVATRKGGQSEIGQSLRAELGALQDDYDRLLTRHVTVHGALYDRVRLDLGGGTDRALLSEELLEKSRVGTLSPALVEKAFDAGRYNILSATGDMPPNLQGIWAGTWGPPWSADFTVNGNLQCALASLLPCHMPELMDAYFRYVEGQLADYRENARRLYGCRGIYVPSRCSTHGLQNHFDATWPMTFWTVGGAWASFFFYDHFLHTGDLEFLKRRALPFMKESALFFEDFLSEGRDGRLHFIPSYSPENAPVNTGSQACVDAAMDVALVRELLDNLVAACRLLNTDVDSVRRWEGMLDKLPDYRINADGALQEWCTPALEDDYVHRHCSHLYALYGGLPERIATRPELVSAFKTAADKRMDVRRLESGGVMAFGLVQLGLAYASLGEGEAAGEVIDWLACNYWRANFVSTHDPKTLFNVDLSGGFPALVVRVLIDSRPDRLDLFPALPPGWRCGRIEGVLCRGPFVVRNLAWTPDSASVTLWSSVERQLRVVVPSGMSLSGACRASKPGSRRESENSFLVTLPAGQSLGLEFSGRLA